MNTQPYDIAIDADRAFDLAIDANRAYRFEHGPPGTAHVAPDLAPDSPGPVVKLPDGRTVKQVQVSRFESVLAVETWRSVDGRHERVDDIDPFDGHLAEDGSRLVQLRVMPPPPGSWPQYPPVLAGDTLPSSHGSLRDTVLAEIADLAPEGWRAFTVECRATVRRMELVATVTLADGAPRSWSPPLMVGQWLHRLRMREYRSTIGVWFTARFEFTADGATTEHVDIENKPAWEVPQSFGDERDHYADELRFLPRRREAIFPWMYEAAATIQQRGRARVLSNPTQRPPEDNVTDIARLFDAMGPDDRPVWYRPMVGGRESSAILHYLDNAPLVLSSRGLAKDMLATGDDKDDKVVPMGFHTDGRWVWSSQVAYYLRKHRVPPAPALVDHIRENRYRLPAEVPAIAMDRAMALAMGRPEDGSSIATTFDSALAPVREIMRKCQTSPRHYRLEGHQDQSWCLVRVDDWYVVYWADGREKNPEMRFGDIRDAAAYLAGQVVLNQDALRYGDDEELPWWQAPFPVLSELDPPLQEFTGVMVTTVVDLEVDRYGTPDGNLAYAAGTPRETLAADHEHHRYRLRGPWKVVTAVSSSASRVYVLPGPIAEYLATGHIDDLTTAPHPGLPPITDALRAEAKRNPGGWVWCADPDVDPRYIEGVPDFALLGAYRVDQNGDLTGETRLNTAYRPGPRRRGFSEPQSEFETILGYVVAGWLPQDRLPRAALNTQFLVESDPTGSFRIGVSPNGTRFLAVYSSSRYLPPTATNPSQVPAPALLHALADTMLVVNPGDELSVELPGNDLIQASRPQEP